MCITLAKRDGIHGGYSNWSPHMSSLKLVVGGSRPTQPKVPRSVQICIWGGGGPDQLNPKCQDLSKSAFLGERERGGGPDQLNPKCQDLSKSAFSVLGEGVVVQTDSTQSAKICPNLHGGGGGGGWFRLTFLKYLSGGTQGILNQKFWQLECVVHHR